MNLTLVKGCVFRVPTSALCPRRLGENPLLSICPGLADSLGDRWLSDRVRLEGLVLDVARGDVPAQPAIESDPAEP